MQLKIIVSLLMLICSLRAYSEAPTIGSIDDKVVSSNSIFSFTPTLDNTANAGTVNWTKAYGPDNVKVNAVTGSISWILSSDILSESFHIGLKASNGDGADIESFIVHVGIDKLVYIGVSEENKTLADAFASERSLGTTYILRNGTYSGEPNKIGFTGGGNVQHPPSGEAGRYTTVMAQDPGEVVFVDGAQVDITGILGQVGYIAIKGLFVKGGTISTTGYYDATNGGACSAVGGCIPHHIKFIRNGVEADLVTPFNAFRSEDILFENNYAFGGGRYKFASYQSERILWRRNVARRDRATVPGEPKGTYSVYTTMGALVVNSIAIDGDQRQFVTSGEPAGEFTCPTTSGPTRVKFERSIQLNSDHLLGNADYQAANCDGQYTDIVSWDVRPVGAYVMTRAASLFDHVTLGNVKPRGSTQVLFNGWPGANARGVIDSVLHDFRGLNNEPMFWGMSVQKDVEVIDRLLDRHGIDTVNITGFSGNLVACCTTVLTDTISSVDPIYSGSNTQGGLRYLVRIEGQSTLSTIGDSGRGLGANVMTFQGESGTLYNEDGFDSETDIPMWPFPFEDKIREKFAEYNYTGPTYAGDVFNRTVSGTGSILGARGFAADGESLTSYIWGYLGNTVPPFEVTASAGDKTVLIKWGQYPSAHASTITQYKIYDYNPDTGNLTNSRTLSNTAFEYLISGLTNGVEYNFVVTAIDSIKGESSFSYSVQAIPASKPKPLPPILAI